MFTATLLVIMAVSIAVLVVLVIYLVDRFNGLERETQHLMRSLQDQQAQARPAGPYAGLSGKALWDTLSGEAGTPMDEATMEGVRKRYRLILGEHIGFVFNEGVSDQRRGLDSVPASTRVVRTPKTQVESWLPPESVAEIYRCGQGYASHDPAQLPELRQRLDLEHPHAAADGCRGNDGSCSRGTARPLKSWRLVPILFGSVCNRTEKAHHAPSQTCLR